MPKKPRLSQRRLKGRLEELLQTRDPASDLARDPLRFAHRFENPKEQEFVGLLASSLAFGNVTSIGNSIERVLDILGDSPTVRVRRLGRRRLERKLEGFVHRLYRGEHVAALLHRAATLSAASGGLGVAFEESYRKHGGLRPALKEFADRLRGPKPDRAMAHLLADPAGASACKRLLLYLRWMVRGPDGVDLGLWRQIPSSALLIPLDTHVHRIARNVGLTKRATPSWRAAEEVTAKLARFDPDDPTKYDFALCHLGIDGEGL